MRGDDPFPPRTLAQLQATFYDLITAPAGVGTRLRDLGRPPEDMAKMVRSTDRLSAVDRLDIYANMYFYRILDVLRDEYSKVVALIGPAVFHDIVTDYLVVHRPAHPSLREVGARLPGYLARHPHVQGRPWVSELARIERTHRDLFDGDDAEALTLEDVRGIPPDQLGAQLLRGIPGHVILKNRFSTAALWTPHESQEPLEPVGGAPEVAETLLVWRQGLTVFHRIVPPDEELVLEQLAAGIRFDALCDRLLGSLSEEGAALRALELLVQWVGDGLLAAIPACSQTV
jgi:hypothetical protein